MESVKKKPAKTAENKSDIDLQKWIKSLCNHICWVTYK